MPPPELPGYTFQRVLGSGGYSDVFLYEQEMPRRLVAIKVLLAGALDADGLRRFTDEANTMASLSTHPYIVTIFHADVAPGGSPFLVMELYPRPNFSVRARTEQMAVAEVLRTGIQVASAVETAHRAGILHRDIKPANILTSEYGRPGLTDFGIASTMADGRAGAAEGLSIPWSPPEVISTASAGDVTADVYSLAATVYTLLAGRSPFEVPGGTNRSIDLMDRISREEVPPTGRGDVPDALERLLRQAMAKRPEDRPRSAAAFARALQEIEVAQGFQMTPLEVRDEGSNVRSRTVDPDDGTRLKAPVVIRSQAPATTVARPLPDGEPGADAGTVRREAITADGMIAGVAPGAAPAPPIHPEFVPAPATPLDSGAVHVDERPGPDLPQTSEPEPTPGRLVAASLVVLGLVAALVVVRVVMGAGGDGGGPPTTTDPDVAVPVTVGVGPPPPTGIEVSPVDGGVLVSWTLAEGADPAAVYVVTTPGPGATSRPLAESEPGATEVVVPASMDPPPCVNVHGELDGRVGESRGNC